MLEDDNMNNILIKKYLPHRKPFLFVDKILAFKPFKYILTVVNVKKTSFYLSGHFPSKPIMPGVLIIEALAQSSGLLINISKKEHAVHHDFLLGCISDAKFKKKVLPDSQLYLYVSLKKIKNNFWKTACKAFVNGKLVCTSNIICVKNEC